MQRRSNFISFTFILCAVVLCYFVAFPTGLQIKTVSSGATWEETAVAAPTLEQQQQQQAPQTDTTAQGSTVQEINGKEHDSFYYAKQLPACWGNPEEVGPCDYDYQWKPVPDTLRIPGEKDATGYWKTDHSKPLLDTIRVLYLHSRDDYLHRSYRFFYDEVEIAATHPELDVRLWGPGFYNYDASIPLQDNIRQTFGSEDYFQVIYASAEPIFPLNFTSTATTFVYALGDCHEQRCLVEVFPSMDVLAFRYAFEPMDYFRWEQIAALKKERSDFFRNRMNWFPLMYHSTECSLSRNFYPSTPKTPDEKWQDSRPHDVQLFGQTRYPFYPIRYKVNEGMEKGIIRGRPMPKSSWWQEPPQESPPKPLPASELGKFIENDPDTAHLQETPKAWGKGMRETKICVFDSSAERKTIRKFNEAFLSGCVVASDIPSEMEGIFKGVIIELDKDMSMEEIDKILGKALEDPEKLAAMAFEAHKRARHYFNCRNKVDKLLEAASRSRQRERGYWFPYGYSATCRSYATGKDFKPGNYPPWCLNEEGTEFVG